jgi:hypothetical protein
LPHRQVLPVFLCCSQRLASQKIQQNRGSAIGPSLASDLPSKNFFAHRDRKICVQASASSQSNSAANIPSPQVKPDANKADAASPFALLMQATARDSAKLDKLDKKDAKESGDKSADDKPAAGKNDARQKDVGQNDIKRDDSKQDTAPARTASQDSAPAKAGKQIRTRTRPKSTRIRPVTSSSPPPSSNPPISSRCPPSRWCRH